MKFWKIALSAVLAVVLFGCAGRYQAPLDVSTPITGLTKEQVKSSILGAGTQGDAAFGIWKMKVINDKTIQGTLYNRGYEVAVKIPYSAKGYSIQYVSASDNLKDDQGNVHRNYNRWISKLDAKIKKNAFMKQ